MPIQLSGSLVITGSITTTGVITMSGSIASASYSSNSDLLQGTGSVGFATTASFNAVSSSQQQISSSYIALSASYNTFSGSASTRITENSSSIQQVSSSQQQISASLLQVSASYTALSGSYNVFSGSASTRTTQIEQVYATTGSNSFRANQSITGSLVVSSTITAQTLVVQTVTSSILYSSGSNLFGNQLANTQTFTGSVNITGSTTLNGALTGTSTIFSSDGNTLTLSRATPSLGGLIVFKDQVGTSKARIGIENNANDFIIQDGSNNTRLTILNSTGIATFACQVCSPNHIASSTCSTAGLRVYGASGTHQWDMYLNGANLRFSDNTSGGCLVVDSLSTFSSTITAVDINIKTSDPSITLTPNSGTYAFFQKLSTGNGDYLRLYDGTNYTMFWKNQQVGIGTGGAFSTYMLDVNGTGRFSGIVKISLAAPVLELYSTTTSTGYNIYQYTDDKFYIGRAGGADLLTMTSTGAATFSSGIGIGGATATTGGIQFPATAVAIADANNLDDYEEGTFTPTLGTGGGTSGFVYSTRSGSYTKIGNLVNIRVIIGLSTLGGDAGNAYIYDLPFTNGQSTTVIGASIIGGTASTLSNTSILVSASQNYAQLEKSALTAAITKADLTNTTTIIFNATYRV